MARIHRRTIQKDLHAPDNHEGVITSLEPGILECGGGNLVMLCGFLNEELTRIRRSSGGDGSQYQKSCTEYASKFGKLSSGHRTGKGQFSFQSQRKAMPRNAQTTAQLHSSHMLVN